MPIPPSNSLLAPGAPAPDFTLMTQDRQQWSLHEALKQGDVVLCFFPFAFTEVCSVEMRCVDDEMASWQHQGATVVGISCDSFAALKAWSEQLGLRQTLLADLHREVCKGYGLYWSDLNVAQRGTVVVTKNSDGAPTVKWSQAREPGSAMEWQEVLNAVV